MKVLVRFCVTLFLSGFVLLICIGFHGYSVSTAAMPDDDQLNSALTANLADDQTWLHVLVVKNGIEEEYSVQLDEDELGYFLPALVTTELLDIGRDLARDPFEIEAIMAFVNPVYDSSDVADVIEILLYYSDVAADTWGCIKCCFSDEDCCCPRPEDDPDDPGGDKGP